MPSTAQENFTIDPMAFRQALGSFATGVTVVTAKSDSEESKNIYVGTTASSFNSVSLDPPLVLWSIDKRARSLPVYENAEYFAVNVLAADQVSLSNHFARQQDDKFAGIEFETGIGGAPLLKGCAARFQCRTCHVYEGGDHLIIVGEVLDFDTSGRKGLMFHSGRYVVSSFHPCNQDAREEADQSPAFVDDYLHYLVGKSFEHIMQKLKVVLREQGLDENEFRVLASLGGVSGCTLEELIHNSILSEDEVNEHLRHLETLGLLKREYTEEETRIHLSEAGEQRLEPMLKAAKSNEADALGVFTAEEARQLKTSLRKLIAWTV
ncbi:flavin reductase [Pseudoteredinibacter isoporae]|uniref:3-hydroxy-9,10-secoandrosta-1,3,5(10)-triene-9, 17-dione monooxygenase reductase component n=1 Tax=Pseudoteredinibacter isoporae TaxID=570281 RepID=A0A7X0JVB1_9GAMM|nr:flavin reductase [Pseudoteredinibacter isoporae]MBB6522398.1 3-hydroxy-9,10-secoandrosta-1,3,5(10)-triene-9,17-dione monooxygenase reductase component [Pseudoteredinibacter isoporae]NHO87931.1 flavin oxidoreductase [Pseudoteredinibacter isoporae]NIB23738.1 flavin oxidoreductase [Pseudoteredinibacter isoporae]